VDLSGDIGGRGRKGELTFEETKARLKVGGGKTLWVRAGARGMYQKKKGQSEGSSDPQMTNVRTRRK